MRAEDDTLSVCRIQADCGSTPAGTLRGVEAPGEEGDPRGRRGNAPVRLLAPIQRFIRTETSGGIVLAFAAVVALAWANLAAGSYTDFWTTPLSLGAGDFDVQTTLQKFVKDGLMAVFFFVVGLEIKRELAIGELSVPRVARIPFAAALGGMLVPVAIYAALNAGGPAAGGWGIPMATDIAFAAGVLSLMSHRVPPQLAVFLLAVAVIDDIGAILVIAIFYSSGFSLYWLLASLGALLVARLLVRLNVRLVVPYAILAVAAWAAMARSGVSPTLAGVAMGLLIPVVVARDPIAAAREATRELAPLGDPSRPNGNALQRWLTIDQLGRRAVPLGERLEHLVHPWSAFVVLPLFALAYAGIRIDADALGDAAGSAITAGVALGLVVGKIVGVAGGTLIAVRLGIGDLPDGIGALHVAGVAALAGIGFTVSVFVASLALTDPELVQQAKVGILAASLIAGAVGAGLLALAGRRPPNPKALDQD